MAARVRADDDAVPARTLAYGREADALGAVIAAREAATTTPLPLLELAERFSLSPVEVLVLCVAVRVDPWRRAVWEGLSIRLGRRRYC
jgi:hypothetical protein